MDKNDTSLIMYVAEDGVTRIQATFDRDTVWLSIDQMAELFQRDKSVIGKHVRSIFSEGELNKNSVWAKFAYTAADGKTYQVDYYNLDVIISVGYRVKSIRGTQFRIWALQVLREYLLKGGSVNQRIDSLERRVSRTEEKIDFFVRTSLPPVEGIFFQGQIFDFFLIFLIIIRSFAETEANMRKPLSLFLVFLGFVFFVSCSSPKSQNDSMTDSDSHTDSDDLTVIEDAETDSQDSDFIYDSDETDDEGRDSENDEDLPDEANSLTQECFGKKVLTKEIVEIDWQGDGFENGVGFDYSYQIDRYYDKNCRVKFENKSKCTSANSDECDGLSFYEYDEKGNVTSICTESYCRYFSYKFNDDGSVEKMCHGKSTDKEAGCIHYRYDENGKIQRETHYNLPGYVAGADEFLEDLYWPEAEEYFYDDEGKVIRKERFFAYKEFDENNRLISVYKYDYSSFLSRTLLAKKSVKYDYYVSEAIPVTSWHNIYNFYDAIGAGWKKSRYERDYFYDENLKPVRVNINPLIGIFSWLDDEWEYYSDGSLKRKRENVESDDGQTKVTTERIYDEKGRETVYQELNALGEAKKRVEKTYYDETNLVKTENYCSEDSCTMADYSYEFDEFGRITVRNKIYENGIIKGEITRFKYAGSGKLEESKLYWALEDAEGNEFLGQRQIELYFYDERENLVERRFAEEWDEETPDAGAMFAEYMDYDSMDRLVEDGRFIYDYHGNTQSTDKIWYKIGTTGYEYDQYGNVVSEKYLEPEGSAWEEYSIDFEYDENNDLVSSEKHYKENKKESRKYFYETFKEE